MYERRRGRADCGQCTFTTVTPCTAVDFDSPIVVIYATWIAAIIETDIEVGEGRGVLAPDRRTNSSPVCATGDITCNLLALGMRASNRLNV